MGSAANGNNGDRRCPGAKIWAFADQIIRTKERVAAVVTGETDKRVLTKERSTTIATTVRYCIVSPKLDSAHFKAPGGANLGLSATTAE